MTSVPNGDGREQRAMVSVTQVNLVRMASIVGNVNIANVADIRDTVERASASESRLILSFEKCTACDSSGISVLLRLYRRLGDRLSVIAPRRTPFRRILDVAALTSLLPVVESLEAAMRYISPDFPGTLPPFC